MRESTLKSLLLAVGLMVIGSFFGGQIAIYVSIFLVGMGVGGFWFKYLESKEKKKK